MTQNTDNKDRYKDTVHLPKTDFPMKANLPQREPEMINKWSQDNLYKKILSKNEGKPTFAMPDGPPYANGNLHMGHALNKILKDIVIKYKNLKGFYAPFIPGWDCHGLPIEQGVLKELGAKQKEKTETELRELCRQTAKKWVGVQKEQFIRYGILGEWENPYLTLDPDYEAETVRTLGKILERGILYRGEKPVYWCLPLQTALAEAEVEYHDHKSPAVYVKFPIKSGVKTNFKKPVSFLIWTTTPWTLPANLGISVHPDFEYEIFDIGDEGILVARSLKEFIENDTGHKLKPTGETFKGEKLEKALASHPFYDRDSLVMLGLHVTGDAGTGLVHTAPGHGQDDYKVGLQYGLELLSPVNNAGKFVEDVDSNAGIFKQITKDVGAVKKVIQPKLADLKVFDANPIIVKFLEESNALFHYKEITHSYPHCWRTKTPLIFRATPQWFIRMDDTKFSLRERALSTIKEVKWVPSWGENRITGMIANRPDWCVSRQRIWGVPIPVFYCQKCSTEKTSREIMNRVADFMDKDGGIDAYHNHTVKEFLGGDNKCKKCGHTEFDKGKDILDVWFDSGSCFAAVQNKRKGLTNPADLYLEGSDQHRGWFHTSLLASLAADDVAPYKTVLTHGFVMYSKGVKMSKSLGNVIDPRDVIKNSGAEILRLWAAHEDYAQDMSCSPELFERVTETYRRFRNTMRFLLGNMAGFDPKSNIVAYEDLMKIDQWLLAKLNALIENVDRAYQNYEFYKVYHLVNNFVTVELSAVYLDVLKDRLYTWKKDGTPRKAAQMVLYTITKTLTGLMAPITSFLSEETYQQLPGAKFESVFLEDFPKTNPKWAKPELIEKFDVLLGIRSDVSKQLEEMRQAKTIGASLEASVDILADGDKQEALNWLGKDLRTFLIVSEANVKSGAYKISSHKHNGSKCVRCWHYYDAAKANSEFPDVCEKCVEALT